MNRWFLTPSRITLIALIGIVLMSMTMLCMADWNVVVSASCDPNGTSRSPIILCTGEPTLVVNFSATTTDNPPVSTSECDVSGPAWQWSGDVNNGNLSVSFPTNTTGTITKTATATATYTYTKKDPSFPDCPDPESKTGSRTVTVVVLGDNDVRCEQILPITIWKFFTNVIVSKDFYTDKNDYTYWTDYKRSGLISGTSQPTYKNYDSPWSTCGGSISVSNSESWTIGGDIGITWTAMKDVISLGIGINFSWSGTLCVTWEHTGIQNRKIMQQAWAHPIILTVSGTNMEYRSCYGPPIGSESCDEWRTGNGEQFNEAETGELNPDRALCIKCCQM
jgi:hypothetical protein